MLGEHLPEVYRLAHWLARNTMDAEDLVQEAALRAYRSFGSFQRGTRFKAWIFRILTNVHIDRNRKISRRKPTYELDPECVEAPSETPELPPLEPGLLTRIEDSLDETVKMALDELPEPYQLVFLFYGLGDLTYEEISLSLEIPVGTVMSRLYRARRKLQESLSDFAHREGYISRSVESS
ncbi:MAG: sigma-70 family RNA polymerase sigma factor [Planctomycetota bacterium]|nr:sigma-70 family RNA polymerase sigma factor [Planctomycetota bacterium]